MSCSSLFPPPSLLTECPVVVICGETKGQGWGSLSVSPRVLVEGLRVSSWPGSLCLCHMVPRDKIRVHLSKSISVLLWEKISSLCTASTNMVFNKPGVSLEREERAGWSLGLGKISTTVVRCHAHRSLRTEEGVRPMVEQAV